MIAWRDSSRANRPIATFIVAPTAPNAVHEAPWLCIAYTCAVTYFF
eukprot:COSAG01_NODE_3579_length_5913_cov_14.430513_1_plen_46_part_00